MTKAELIRKIAKRAGVPDSEAKVFFEIFLKKSSELLKPGEAVLLKGFGHFQFRKGKIRTNINRLPDKASESVFVDLMVFYPTQLPEEDIKKEIIFNVPALQHENYNPLDSHFSFSIGKPVIPLKDVSSTDFFIPLTGIELRKLVEARVDKLLGEIEVVKEYTKGNEILIIDAGSIKSHQLEFNWGDKPSGNIVRSKLTAKSKNSETKPEEQTEEVISWNFGVDLSKEIEEESILDTDKEETTILGEENQGENINWNFGVTIVDDETQQPAYRTGRPEIKTENDERSFDDKSSTLEKAGSVGIPHSDGSHPFGKSEFKNFTSEDEPETENKFERVRSFSSFFDEDKSVSMPDEASLNNFRKSGTASYQEYEPDTQINEESVNEETQAQIPLPEEERELSEGKNTPPLIADDEIDTTSTAAEETSELSVRDEEEKEPSGLTSDSDEKPYIRSSVITRRLESESYYSRKGTSPIFLIALFVIIAVALALYFYLNKTFDFTKKAEADKVTQSTIIHPNIVERDYSIPVTYPYNIEQAGLPTGQVSLPTRQTGTKPDVENISPKALNEVKTPEVKKVETKKNEVKKIPGDVTTTRQPKENKKAVVENSRKQQVNDKKMDASAFSFDNLPPPADTAKLHENIFSAGGNYTVQVSSWRSKSIADQQAAKFRSKGYDAYVEKAEIPNRGTWYRVKIKNFKSMRDAENFLISNQ